MSAQHFPLPKKDFYLPLSESNSDLTASSGCGVPKCFVRSDESESIADLHHEFVSQSPTTATVVIPVQHVEQINDLQTAHADSEGKLMGSSLSANE